MQTSSDTCNIRQAAFRFGMVYWGGVFVFSSLLWSLAGTDPLESAVGKLLHYALSSIITFGISALLFWLHGKFTKVRSSESALPLLIGASFILSLAAGPLWASLGYAVYAVCIWPLPAAFDWKDFSYDTVYGAGLIFGWSCLFITLIFSFELNDRELRIAAAREEALSAQMRALRYQINPHFLFNTLNSVVELIEDGSSARAERMVLSLSNFLRTTLSLDPLHDVPLSDELALQKEYLEIERERFSDRMVFDIDMPENLRGALVPSLILQPLIENAIKHGVGATVGKVEIVLRVRGESDRLHITVENDMSVGVQHPNSAGMGIGLCNVAERLRARFQENALISSGVICPGRYRTSINLPLRLFA